MINPKVDYFVAGAENECLFTSFSRTRLTDRIGSDLRGVYDDMTVATQPDHLVELANRIDAKLRNEQRDG